MHHNHPIPSPQSKVIDGGCEAGVLCHGRFEPLKDPLTCLASGETLPQGIQATKHLISGIR